MDDGSSKEILTSSLVQDSMKGLATSCRSDWSKLGNAHILLTGGTGFFGSWIIVSFAALRQMGLPIEMTVLSRDPTKFLEKNPSLKSMPGLAFRKGDVTDATIPFSITHIMHFATTGSKAETPAAEKQIRHTVIDGTKHLLEEAKRVGASRFMLASSGAVYGRTPSQGAAIGEGRGPTDQPREDILRTDVPLSAYGQAKREAEELCRRASISRDIETVITRGFTFSGPLFPTAGPYVISTFMSALMNGLPLQVRTPSSIRSFLDGRDLVRVLWMLLARGRNGEAYNVGSDESVTMGELADMMRAVAIKVSLRVPEIRLLAPSVTRTADIYRPSIEKLTAEFGWKPTIALRDSLRAQAQWAVESVDKHPGKTYP